MDNQETTAANLAAPMSTQEATRILIAKRTKANQYAKVEPGMLYYRALGAIYSVPDNEVNRAAIEKIGSRVLPLKEGGVVGNGEVVNARYIVDFKWADGTNDWGIIEAPSDIEARRKFEKKCPEYKIIKIRPESFKPFGSRNAVVNAALAWKKAVVLNDMSWDEIKIGQKVQFWPLEHDIKDAKSRTEADQIIKANQGIIKSADLTLGGKVIVKMNDGHENQTNTSYIQRLYSVGWKDYRQYLDSNFGKSSKSDFDQLFEEEKIKKAIKAVGASNVSFSYPLQSLNRGRSKTKVGGQIYVKGEVLDAKVIDAGKRVGYALKYETTKGIEKVFAVQSMKEFAM